VPSSVKLVWPPSLRYAAARRSPVPSRFLLTKVDLEVARMRVRPCTAGGLSKGDLQSATASASIYGRTGISALFPR
jgi:hypothetical protein